MLTVTQCMIGETAWFRKLEGEYHYMGESHGAGDVVRRVVEEEGAPVALRTWAAACYCLKARDERIGWNPAMRARRGRAAARRAGRRSACPGAQTAMLAGCPEGFPRHGRRASRALAGRDCGQGILSRTPRLAGQGFFSETSGWKRKETVCQMKTPWPQIKKKDFIIDKIDGGGVKYHT